MDTPGTLQAAKEYLSQANNTNDGDPIEVSDNLLQDLEKAVEVCRQELRCELYDEKTTHSCTDESTALESQIRDLNSNISSQFSDLREIPYRLQSVFIHRGSHNAGHYWIYIYDFNKRIWRKYNDGYVTEVKDTREIFEQEPGARPATPYFLVYVKEERREQLVDPVCRDPFELPLEESQDVAMEDFVEIPTQQTIADTYSSIADNSGLTQAPNKEHPPPSIVSSGWDNQQAW